MSATLTYDAAYLGEVPIASPSTQAVQESFEGPGSYPRMLVLGDKVEARFRDWLDYELHAFFAERSETLEQWKAWQTLYWAEPEKAVRTFPFYKAANIVIPLSAIAVEAVHARMMNTLFSVEPFWSIRPQSKPWIQTAKPMERYLQSEATNSQTLNVYPFCNDSILELIKLGTAVGKSGYRREYKKSYRDTDEFFYESYNGATLERVPLANFIMRLSELDPQTAPLVGERHRLSWAQLKKMAQAGRFDEDAVEKIKHWWRDINSTGDASDGQDYEQHVKKLATAEPMWTDRFDIDEIWCAFDVDEDGYDEEVVVEFHKPSGTFLAARYNWYDDLHRPYHIGNYVNVEGTWVGLGLCKQVEQFQEAATTVHRQRLDNATLANMAQIVIKKGSGVDPNTPIFPGKMWFLDDVSDIKDFKLSEIYPSSYNNEASIINYYEKRSGANEVILGMPHEGTPGTATSDLTRLAEGNKRFDLVLKNVRFWLSNLGLDVVTNYQLFGNQEAHWWVLGEDGAYVEEVLRMPTILVRRGAIVDLTVTDSITNREVEQRQWLSLFQVITGYYDRVLQLAQVLGDPQIFLQIAQKAMAASDEAMRRLLETFTITDAGRFALVEETPNGGPGSVGGAVQGSESGPAGVGEEAGLASVPSSNGRTGGELGFGGPFIQR